MRPKKRVHSGHRVEREQRETKGDKNELGSHTGTYPSPMKDGQSECRVHVVVGHEGSEAPRAREQYRASKSTCNFIIVVVKVQEEKYKRKK